MSTTISSTSSWTPKRRDPASANIAQAFKVWYLEYIGCPKPKPPLFDLLLPPPLFPLFFTPFGTLALDHCTVNIKQKQITA